MTAGLAGPGAGAVAPRPSGLRLHDYFWSDAPRRIQTALGLLWLLDGGLQFQSFMYSHAFLASLAAGAQGEPAWLHASILWGVRFANPDLTLWNTLFALTQVLIGVGLLVRPLTRPALVGSLAWVLVVWWFGEAFGMLLANVAQPLTGAPGGVLLYGLAALLAWPGERPGGLLGVRGARTMWCSLWLLMAYLWLLAASSAPDATRAMLTRVPSGIGALTSLQHTLARASAGHGLVIAIVLSAVTAAVAVAVAVDWHARAFLAVAIVLNLAYWIVPQGLGGLFAGGATDPNAGPLFILLACAMVPLVGRRDRGPSIAPSPSEARP